MGNRTERAFQKSYTFRTQPLLSRRFRVARYDLSDAGTELTQKKGLAPEGIAWFGAIPRSFVGGNPEGLGTFTLRVTVTEADNRLAEDPLLDAVYTTHRLYLSVG